MVLLELEVDQYERFSGCTVLFKGRAWGRSPQRPPLFIVLDKEPRGTLSYRRKITLKPLPDVPERLPPL
jgi:hypothetical protein